MGSTSSAYQDKGYNGSFFKYTYKPEIIDTISAITITVIVMITADFIDTFGNSPNLHEMPKKNPNNNSGAIAAKKE